ncbi:MAG: NAD(P)-dependent alcohol dehydrogenase [Candidatus Lokiarchaeota archaeon]|nr:NAD(P)-dependent alcohol dehydrogenase [Candidatus Lokiarchaeota archaeon]
MKAIVCTKYGPPEVLQLKEVEKPTPKDNEVLIKIHAATVTMGDCEMRSLKFSGWLKVLMRLGMGFRGPRKSFSILGQELAGEIEAVGKHVKLFKEGDQVFAAPDFVHLGTCTEYICLPEESKEGLLAKKPTNMTFEEAAAVPVGSLEALYFMGNGNIKSGQKVLINGAGGTIGTFAIQLAKYFEVEVTGVDSTGKLDILRSIGADFVIDYTQEDFTEKGEIYDVIFDVVGKRSLSNLKKSLKKNGLILLANPKFSHRIRGKFSSVRVKAGTANSKAEDLIYLKELIEAGKIKSVVDSTYPLEEIVEAHRYVETGNKKGHVVIKIVE